MITGVVPSPFLFPLTAVIKPPTVAAGSSETQQWSWPSGSVTVRANLQPLNSRDAMLYGRETGTNLYDLFIETRDTNGAAISLTDAQLKDSAVSVSGRTLRVVGAKIDPISAGAVYRLVCEEDY